MNKHLHAGGLLMPGAPRPKHHPLANLFPMLADNRRESFRDSLAEQQNHPIVLHKGLILDGRNRERELVELGKPVAFAVFVGTDRQALEFVVAENIERRHLETGQRAAIAAKITTLRLGDNQYIREGVEISTPLFQGVGEEGPSQDAVSAAHAATMMSVDRATVFTAKKVYATGVPELQQALEAGEISTSAAANIAALPMEEQRAIVAAADPKVVKEVSKKARKEQNDARRAERSSEITRLAEASVDLPTGRKFPLIYMDPPTKFAAGDSDRSTENHYPTMTEEQIAALPVSDLALDKAVLLIWSTVPWLHKTLRLIEGWGFEYKSCAVWDKADIGLGFWWQNQHEILIAATRGNPVVPENGSIMGPSLYREKKTRHSAKPEYFRAMIDSVPEWKDWPKVELFSRVDGAMPEGWRAWGNEARVQKQQTLGIENGEQAA